METFAFLAVPVLMALGLVEPEALKPMPDCGVASVYAVAKHFGKADSLADVEAALTHGSDSGKTKEFSLADLKTSVHALGLYGRNVQVTGDSLYRISLPAILFVRPERLGENNHVGHFLVLQNVLDDRVTVLDFTRSASAWDMTQAELFSFWDGECLEVSVAPFYLPSGWKWTAVWIAVFGVSAGAMLWKWRVPARSSLALVSACIVLMNCGCGKSDPTPLLTFEQEAYSAGEVKEGDAVNILCSFVNSSRQSVIVQSVKAGCECITQDKSLEGQTLAPGSRHSFLVSLNTLKRVGDIGGTITLITEPPSPLPISVEVSAVVAESPQVVQSLPLRVSTRLGEIATIEFAVEFYRQKTSSALSWNEQGSTLHGFEVRRCDSRTQDYVSQGNMKRGANRDLLQWTLMTPADLPLGEHHYELQLNLGNSFPDPLKVPVVIRVLHPIQLSLDRVFFGIFCEGEEKTVDVSLRDLTLIDLSRLVVRSDNPLVLAEKREDEKLIRLILSPSIPPGQFKGSVSLSLADSKVPELLLPYSGIVQTGQ